MSISAPSSKKKSRGSYMYNLIILKCHYDTFLFRPAAPVPKPGYQTQNEVIGRHSASPHLSAKRATVQ